MIELPRLIILKINIFFKMKTFKTYFGILVLSLTLFSCTNDVTVNQVHLIKQIVEISTDGSSTTTTINYDGSKIVNIDNNVKRTSYFYTGLLITKMEELDKVANHTNTMFFTYSTTDLVKMVSSDNYIVNYIHNADGTVSYEKLTKDDNNKDVKVNHGVLYFQSSNLIKDVMIVDSNSAFLLSTKTSSYTYDGKINGLQNVIGFSALLNYGNLISINNSVTTIVSSETKYLDTEQSTSSMNLFKNENKYNVDGYLTEIVGESSFFGDRNSNHSKTLLYY